MTPSRQRRRAAGAVLAVLSVLALLSPLHVRGDAGGPHPAVPQVVASAAVQVAVAERAPTSDARSDAPVLPWATAPATGSLPAGAPATADRPQRGWTPAPLGADAQVRGPPSGTHL